LGLTSVVVDHHTSNYRAAVMALAGRGSTHTPRLRSVTVWLLWPFRGRLRGP